MARYFSRPCFQKIRFKQVRRRYNPSFGYKQGLNGSVVKVVYTLFEVQLKPIDIIKQEVACRKTRDKRSKETIYRLFGPGRRC